MNLNGKEIVNKFRIKRVSATIQKKKKRTWAYDSSFGKINLLLVKFWGNDRPDSHYIVDQFICQVHDRQERRNSKIL